jgi:hypothetical protein
MGLPNNASQQGKPTAAVTIQRHWSEVLNESIA